MVIDAVLDRLQVRDESLSGFFRAGLVVVLGTKHELLVFDATVDFLAQGSFKRVDAESILGCPLNHSSVVPFFGVSTYREANDPDRIVAGSVRNRVVFAAEQRHDRVHPLDVGFGLLEEVPCLERPLGCFDQITGCYGQVIGLYIIEYDPVCCCMISSDSPAIGSECSGTGVIVEWFGRC